MFQKIITATCKISFAPGLTGALAHRPARPVHRSCGKGFPIQRLRTTTSSSRQSNAYRAQQYRFLDESLNTHLHQSGSTAAGSNEAAAAKRSATGSRPAMGVGAREAARLHRPVQVHPHVLWCSTQMPHHTMSADQNCCVAILAPLKLSVILGRSGVTCREHHKGQSPRWRRSAIETQQHTCRLQHRE